MMLGCQRCAEQFQPVIARKQKEGDVHLAINQLGDRGGLVLDFQNLCPKCQKELKDWFYRPQINRIIEECGK